MPRKNKKKSAKKKSLVARWEAYIKKGDLEDWQRLCGDLGLANDLPSKTKCRKVGLLSSIPP